MLEETQVIYLTSGKAQTVHRRTGAPCRSALHGLAGEPIENLTVDPPSPLRVVNPIRASRDSVEDGSESSGVPPHMRLSNPPSS